MSFFDKFKVEHKYEKEKFYKVEDVDKKDNNLNRKRINEKKVEECNGLTQKNE